MSKTKRIITLTLTIVLSIFTCINISANNIENNIITINNVDVQFQNDSCFTNEQKQFIADNIVNSSSENNISTYGLTCTLFGHKYNTENVTTTTHCAKAAAPRCLVEEWEISVCSRCEDTISTNTANYYIYCCS